MAGGGTALLFAAAAVAQVDECRERCAACANGYCAGATQRCFDPDLNVSSNWQCHCLRGEQGVGNATGGPATCVYNECTERVPSGNAVCGAEQTCTDPGTAAPTLSGVGVTAEILTTFGVGELGLGQGSCRTDADCRDGLYCHFNPDGSIEVPGVDVNGLTAAQNVCAFPFLLPLPPYQGKPPHARKLTVGEGDCDQDSDCESGLRCWRRGVNRLGAPGIEEHADGNLDFCYKMAVDVTANNAPLVRPLAFGEGPCTSHSDCGGGTLCYFRHDARLAWVPIPGIDTAEVSDTTGVCYNRPDMSSRGGSVNDWTCACNNGVGALAQQAAVLSCAAPPTPPPTPPIPPTPPTPVATPQPPLASSATSCFALPSEACISDDAIGCILDDDYRAQISTALSADGVFIEARRDNVDQLCRKQPACVDGCEITWKSLPQDRLDEVDSCNTRPDACSSLLRRGLKTYGSQTPSAGTPAPATLSPATGGGPRTAVPLAGGNVALCLDTQRIGAESGWIPASSREKLMDAAAADAGVDVSSVFMTDACPQTNPCPSTHCLARFAVPSNQRPFLDQCRLVPADCPSLRPYGVGGLLVTDAPDTAVPTTPAPPVSSAGAEDDDGGIGAGWIVVIVLLLLLSLLAALFWLHKHREQKKPVRKPEESTFQFEPTPAEQPLPYPFEAEPKQAAALPPPMPLTHDAMERSGLDDPLLGAEQDEYSSPPPPPPGMESGRGLNGALPHPLGFEKQQPAQPFDQDRDAEGFDANGETDAFEIVDMQQQDVRHKSPVVGPHAPPGVPAIGRQPMASPNTPDMQLVGSGRGVPIPYSARASPYTPASPVVPPSGIVSYPSMQSSRVGPVNAQYPPPSRHYHRPPRVVSGNGGRPDGHIVPLAGLGSASPKDHALL